MRKNFVEFLQRLPFYGLAVICIDDEGIQGIRDQIVKPVLTYSVDYDADFFAHAIRQEQNKTWFKVSKYDCREWLDIELNLPGKHNVQNALAAIAIAHELNVPETSIVTALKNFQGIARRCQVLGNININDKHLLVIDDYAHHPSEIHAIIQAINAGWPERRLVLIFQPHRYSRTRDLFEDFTKVLSMGDVLLLLDIYPAGEESVPGADSRSLCRAIRLRGQVDPIFVEQRSELDSLLSSVVEDDDILVILGAGDIGSLAPELMQKYREQMH